MRFASSDFSGAPSGSDGAVWNDWYLPDSMNGINPVVEVQLMGKPPRMPMNETWPHCDHTLFMGSIPCCYHNNGEQIGTASRSFLCPSEAQFALGEVEDLIVDAVDEINEIYGGNLGSVVLFNACQPAFLGIDLDRVSSMLAKRGIVCLRREHCRILMPDPSRGVYGTGSSVLASEYDQLVRFLKRSDETNASGKADASHENSEKDFSTEDEGSSGGLLVVADAPLDEWGELSCLANGNPFPWVEVLGDEVSFDRLDYLSGASIVLGAGEQGVRLGERVAEQLGVPCCIMRPTYDIAEVDQAYEELSEYADAPINVEYFRCRAIAAIDRAQQVCAGRPLALNLTGVQRPWNLVYMLLVYGFALESVQVSSSFGLPGMSNEPSDEDNSDYEELLRAFPFVENLITELPPQRPMPPGAGMTLDTQFDEGVSYYRTAWRRRPGVPDKPVPTTLRSGSINFPTSGPGPRTRGSSKSIGASGGSAGSGVPGTFGGAGAPGVSGGSNTPALASWGYAAIEQCMEHIIAAATAPIHEQFGWERGAL